MPSNPGQKLPYSTQQIQVALPWLARLRWIAVIGQIGACALAILWLHLRLPVAWIALVISVTALSNLTLQVWHRIGPAPDGIAPAIILLDVGMLTVLLYLTGGTNNPFTILYAIHVAMAVVVLGGGWAWIVVLLSALCYALVYRWHEPLKAPRGMPSQAIDLGRWGSLVLVMGLTTYFIARVMRSLRRRERELAEIRERARRSEHLAALTTLAAGAAHELGTPLGTIALAAKEMELSSRRGDDAASLAEDAQLIRKEVDRCRSILDRMRVDVIEDVGQRPACQTLAELTAALRRDLRPSERDRLQIVTTQPPETAIWRARVLRQALNVLLRNAFDASTSDGRVQLLCRREQKHMIFQVQDSGSGMSQSVLRRAGEPFFTTKPPGAGMGLGLFLVRLVADTYGGKFEINSTPGVGTCSILQLPDRFQDNRPD